MGTDVQTPRAKLVIITGRDCWSASWINYSLIQLKVFTPTFSDRSSGPVSFGYSELENNNSQHPSIISTPGGEDYKNFAPPGLPENLTTLRKELKVGQAGD